MFTDTKGKSIIVIEDIDCTLDLTGKRRHKRLPLTPLPVPGPGVDAGDASKAVEPLQLEPISMSKVTLSGLLSFIDGLWSACGGEA
jgi:chaperone BCS1